MEPLRCGDELGEAGSLCCKDRAQRRWLAAGQRRQGRVADALLWHGRSGAEPGARHRLRRGTLCGDRSRPAPPRPQHRHRRPRRRRDALAVEPAARHRPAWRVRERRRANPYPVGAARQPAAGGRAPALPVSRDRQRAVRGVDQGARKPCPAVLHRARRRGRHLQRRGAGPPRAIARHAPTRKKGRWRTTGPRSSAGGTSLGAAGRGRSAAPDFVSSCRRVRRAR